MELNSASHNFEYRILGQLWKFGWRFTKAAVGRAVFILRSPYSWIELKENIVHILCAANREPRLYMHRVIITDSGQSGGQCWRITLEAINTVYDSNIYASVYASPAYGVLTTRLIVMSLPAINLHYSRHGALVVLSSIFIRLQLNCVNRAVWSNQGLRSIRKSRGTWSRPDWVPSPYSHLPHFSAIRSTSP